MRYQLLSILILACTLFTSCEDDPGPRVLNYDGANLDAPLFAPGDYEMAARFPISELSRFQGRFLEEIEVYIRDRPARAEIVVYGEGSNFEPGLILYSQIVTPDMRSGQWNTHTLNTPLEIVGDEDIWLAIRVRHTQPMASVGCDAGPAVDNGDLLEDANGQWTDLRAFTNNAININWNIRGIVSE